jgi:hypothetical protein
MLSLAFTLVPFNVLFMVLPFERVEVPLEDYNSQILYNCDIKFLYQTYHFIPLG